MFKNFHQKRERVEKKVIFDPVEGLGAANLLFFVHSFRLLEKYILTELIKMVNFLGIYHILGTHTHCCLEWEYAFIAQRKLRGTAFKKPSPSAYFMTVLRSGRSLVTSK